MDLPLFNIVIKANENWQELFDARFELMYNEKIFSSLVRSDSEYILLKKLAGDWVRVCVYNTTHFEIARDAMDTYDQYEVKFKFPKYTFNACLAIYRPTCAF